MTEHIAFIDLETTGLDPIWDEILEVGLVLCDMELQPIRSFTAVAHFDVGIPRPGGEVLSQTVVDMHRANGLWDDCLESTITLDTIDDVLADWLDKQTGGGHKIALAGSGVSHFDHAFLKAQMPKVAKRLTYWSYDVGTIRRFLELAQGGIPFPNPSDRKPHRALEDAALHLEEARAYLDLFRQAHFGPIFGIAS